MFSIGVRSSLELVPCLRGTPRVEKFYFFGIASQQRSPLSKTNPLRQRLWGGPSWPSDTCWADVPKKFKQTMFDIAMRQCYWFTHQTPQHLWCGWFGWFLPLSQSPRPPLLSVRCFGPLSFCCAHPMWEFSHCTTHSQDLQTMASGDAAAGPKAFCFILGASEISYYKSPG